MSLYRLLVHLDFVDAQTVTPVSNGQGEAGQLVDHDDDVGALFCALLGGVQGDDRVLTFEGALADLNRATQRCRAVGVDGEGTAGSGVLLDGQLRNDGGGLQLHCQAEVLDGTGVVGGTKAVANPGGVGVAVG